MAERAAPVLSKAWAWHPSSSPPQGAWGTVFHHCQCERCFKTYYLPFTVEHGHPPQCATAATHPPGSHTALGHLLHLPKLLSFYSVQGEPTGAAALGEGPEAGAQDDSKPCPDSRICHCQRGSFPHPGDPRKPPEFRSSSKDLSEHHPWALKNTRAKLSLLKLENWS